MANVKKLELKKLVEAGVHFGHRTARWNPKMRSFIWGAKNKTHLIDVAKTSFLLQRAGSFLAEAAASGKSILWVGTKRPAQNAIKAVADKLDMPYVMHRWIGGTLSNFDQVKKAVTRLLHLRDVVEKSLGKYSKKEQSMIQKEVGRLEKNVGGIINLSYPPAAIVVVDAKKERSTIKESMVMGIPVVGLVDTNTDPSNIPYVIPANDDSPKSIELILNYLGDAVAVGVKEAAAKAQAEREAKAKEKEAKAAAKKDAKAETKVEAKAEKKEVKAEAKPAAKKAPAKAKTAEKTEAKEVKAAPKKAAAKTTKKAEEKVEAKPAAKKAAPKKAAAKAPAKKTDKAADKK